MNTLLKGSYCLTQMLPKSGRCLTVVLRKFRETLDGQKHQLATRTEVLGAIRSRYREGAKKCKSRMLDEFVAIAGCHRKHSVRLLRQFTK